MRFKQGLLGFFLAFGITSTYADQITDGSLGVDIDNDGEFNVITLNGQNIDTSGFVQQQRGSCTGFSAGSVINTTGSSSTYTAQCGSFDVAVTSSIVGPLASNPAVTNVLEQVFTFVNNTAGNLTLESISNIDQDLVDGGNDVVQFDNPTQAVFATDSVATAPNTLLMAAIAQASFCGGGIFGYDVDTLGNQSLNFPMDNGVGPVGPADTAMSIGYNCGTIAPNQVVKITFRYLFSTNLSAVPASFDFTTAPPPVVPEVVPSLSQWGLVILSLLLMIVAVPLSRRN